MHGATVALPCTPFEALEGIPPPEVLSTPIKRQRYGQALACALAGVPSWTVVRMRWDDVPPELELRAGNEDWPMAGSFHGGVAYLTILKPLPLPERPEALVEAACVASGDRRVGQQLRQLLAGEYPESPAAPAERKTYAAALCGAAERGHHELSSGG